MLAISIVCHPSFMFLPDSHLQALPFYWYDDRIPETNNNEPFFDCLKCLDEVDEIYSTRVACTDW